MLVKPCYISSNCNQTPTAADWGPNNLICYASCNAVFIYDPNIGSGGLVTHCLVCHQKRVNSVKWLRGDSTVQELVSGSTDGDVIVWSLKENSYTPAVLKGHTSNVNIVDGLYRRENEAVVVSASMDSTVKVWIRVADEFKLSQTINFDYHICVGLRVSFLIHTELLLLATALDNSKINLYIQDEDIDDLTFKCATTLKGHDDWVRGLDFTIDGNDVLLASSSQDMFIRLWRITSETKQVNDDAADDILKQLLIKTRKAEYHIYLEAVLYGHEGWVYSVHWNANKTTLLSASLDKSMIIWEYDKDSCLWLEKIRVGEVGGNTLGFYGGVFGPDGDTILAHSYHGAFHIWKRDEMDNWNPAVTVGGHFNQVVDLGWDPQGEFLISASTDQTTRVHAPWPTARSPVTWHEIGRPQVHGYDMSGLAVLSRYKFASCSEEKVVRTFKAPRNFIENFRRICKIEGDPEGDGFLNGLESGPKGASVPSLGLSNKAVFSDNNSEQSQPKNNKEVYPEESRFTAVELTEPPTEETLIQNTLWPEIQKLYGHGYEVYTLAASPDGKYLASACKATTPEHAAVLLWDTTTWKQLQKLHSHTLTVAQIAFAPDSQKLLTVSRDRRWSLFTRKGDEFVLSATVDKNTSIHSRIIWCCAWSHDSVFFTTGSRDGKAVVWRRNADKPPEGVLGQIEPVGQFLNLKNESITAAAFAPNLIRSDYLVALGLESGFINLYRWNQEWKFIYSLNQSLAHHLTVKRILFRPIVGEAGNKEVSQSVIQMASCSSDCSVKIYNILLNK